MLKTETGFTVTPAEAAMTGLPEYPEMKLLEIGDRLAVEACTRRLPSSSDHNFTSLWMWDTLGQTQLSRIGSNLVIQLADYQTHEPRLTLIGDDDVASAAENLFSSGVEQLHLVPDCVAGQLPAQRFLIESDRDQCDYIYDIERMAALAGFHKAKRQADRCEQALGERLRVVSSIAEPQSLVELFDRWVASRGKDMADTSDERAAIGRLVGAWEKLSVNAFGLYDQDHLIAATVDEPLPDGAISHYGKADATYPGIFPLLERASCQRLARLGVRELNVEQDLGIEGLRAYKLKYRPVRFVEKYRVRASVPR